MKLIWFLIIPFLVLVIACSSVRTNTSARKQIPPKSLTTKKQDKKIQEQPKSTVKSKSRFTDTANVVVKPNIRTTNISINSQLDSSIFNYEKGNEDGDSEKMDKACLEINSFAETFAEGDSLKYEALFYKCECLIYKVKYYEAAKELLEIITDKRLPKSVLERALIRLGQVYCAMNKGKEASDTFAKFNRLFPNSIYKEFANCESLRHSE